MLTGKKFRLLNDNFLNPSNSTGLKSGLFRRSQMPRNSMVFLFLFSWRMSDGKPFKEYYGLPFSVIVNRIRFSPAPYSRIPHTTRFFHTAVSEPEHPGLCSQSAFFQPPAPQTSLAIVAIAKAAERVATLSSRAVMLNHVGVHLFVWIYGVPGDSPRALMFNPFGVHSGPQRGPIS